MSNTKSPASATFGMPVWPRFLLRASLALAILLLCSALISVIAANWSELSKTIRIVLVQGVIVLTAGVAWILNKRGHGWWPEYAPVPLMMGLSAVAVGGLWALLGQIYQTGADPWQLFAVWALTITPWLVGLRSIILAVLWIVIVNVAGVLLGFNALNMWSRVYWWVDGPLAVTLIVVVLNTFLLVLSELCQHYLRDPFRVVPRLLAAVTCLALFYLVMGGLMEWEDGFLKYWLGASAVMAAMAWYYRQRSPDQVSLSFVYGAFLAALIPFFIRLGSDDIATWFIFTLVEISLAIVLAKDLFQQWRKHTVRVVAATEQQGDAAPTHTDAASPPWFLRLLRLGAVLLGSALILVTLTLLTDAEIFKHSFWVMLCFVGGGLWLSRQAGEEGLQDIPALLVIVGLVFSGVEWVMQVEQENTIYPFLQVVLGVVLYVLSPVWLVRLLAAGWTLISAFLWLNFHGFVTNYYYEFPWLTPFMQWQVFAVVVASLLIGVRAHQTAERYRYWAPAMWAGLAASLLGIGLMPPVLMFGETLSEWALGSWIPSWLLFPLPAVVLAVALQRQNSWSVVSAAAVAVCVLLSITWAGAPTISLTLAWLLVAYAWRSRLLFVVMLLALFIALGKLYYDFDISLNQKALLLACSAVVLLVYLVIFRGTVKSLAAFKDTDATAAPMPKGMKYLRPGPVILAGLVLVLGLANYNIWNKERILSDGKAVVLALAPVDPRSLMQGDYMSLDFQVARDASRLSRGIQQGNIDAYEEDGSAVWAWLSPPAAGELAWQLQALQSSRDADKAYQHYYVERDDGSNQNQIVEVAVQPDWVVLRLVRKNGQWAPGTDAWFFKEGQAAVFEPAKFAEFRVENGIPLLKHMLDEQGNVLAAKD
ncbi:MAG: GDYXXLXY domain-containing protein [Paenalcaligenes sp.]